MLYDFYKLWLFSLLIGREKEKKNMKLGWEECGRCLGGVGEGEGM